MHDFIRTGAAFIAAATLAGSAAAVTVNTGVSAAGATHVRLVHSSPGGDLSFIQVGELQAFTFAAVNVAQDSNGGVATGTAFFGTLPGMANDGNLNRAYNAPGSIFATQNGPDEFLQIVFSGPHTLSNLVIHGRSDCCANRDSWTVSVFAGATTLWSGLVDASDGSIATVNFTAPSTGGAVPEPASWALLIAGFGLTGAVARRRGGRLAYGNS
jgi:hypothetical protein